MMATPASHSLGAVATSCAVAGWVLALAVVTLIIWLVVILVKNPGNKKCDYPPPDGGSGNSNLNTGGGSAVAAMLSKAVGKASDKEETPEAVPTLKTEADVARFLAGKKHCLAMVYAPWCTHCKAAKPHFVKGAAAAKKRGVHAALINGDEAKELTKKYNILGYPTYLVSKDGGPFTEIDRKKIDRAEPFKAL